MGPLEVEVEVGARRLKLTNLQKVIYPKSGFTKARVIDYYVRIAPVILTHIADRGVTFRRFPDGVAGESFFNKRAPDWRPDWLTAVRGPGQRDGPIDYCQLDEVAAVAWAANLAAIELHAPMARSNDIESPTMVVFDLDPGEGTSIVECAHVALLLRSVLEYLGLNAWPKTSGSKGIQLYVPLNAPHSHAHASAFARATGQMIEREHARLVTTKMGKQNRVNKVLIDWSQNSRHKTTIAPYSLRAMAKPTVSTPITWAEVHDIEGGERLSFEASEVLDRVASMGDAFAETTTLVQHLPNTRLD